MCYEELLYSNHMFWCDFGDGKGAHYNTKFNNNIHPSIHSLTLIRVAALSGPIPATTGLKAGHTLDRPQ